MICLYNVPLFLSLLYLKEAVVNLHGKNKDLVSDASTVMQYTKELEKVREDFEAYSQQIYLHSCRISENFGISMSMPCTSQQHHSSTDSSLVADRMKKKVLFHS